MLLEAMFVEQWRNQMEVCLGLSSYLPLAWETFWRHDGEDNAGQKYLIRANDPCCSVKKYSKELLFVRVADVPNYSNKSFFIILLDW